MLDVPLAKQEADTALTVSEAVKQGHQVRHRAGEAVLDVGAIAGAGNYGASTPSESPPHSCPPMLRTAQGLQPGCTAAADKYRARRP